MSSYCPVCDQFVNNLDDCELPYGGNPAPLYSNCSMDIDSAYESEGEESVTSPDPRIPVDYSDIVEDSQIPDQDTIEANMSYYLVRSGKVFVKDRNQLWEIDVDSTPGLYRQNAMTYYEPLTNYLVLARSVTDQSRLFYLVKCKDHPNQWVQVDVVTGENIYNVRDN